MKRRPTVVANRGRQQWSHSAGTVLALTGVLTQGADQGADQGS